MEQVEVKYAPGMRIIVRGEEWMVKKVETNSLGNQTLHVIGLSQLVKDYESMFLVDIEDDIEIVDPAKVTLVPDNSAFFRKSKVYIESQWRGKIPTDNKIHIGNKAAMDLMSYQLEPAQMALNKTRQRILIADTVGLGKTLEAGILMSELIARGKGKRILVVTVKSMMTQFQKEMWNRFTIPLVRLDSSRIQSVRAKLPTNYNPFFYYDKTIISVDTLKNDLDYRTHLEHAWWDIIVIDEAHNVAKRGDRSSQRSKLASLLANRSDTLIMLTATPHDGKGQSVASLMNMLDPTAIADEENYTKDDIEGLLIRRFKKDIQDQVSGAFKERVITIERCAASAREEAAYDIFADMKLQMDESRTRGKGILFKTSLEKSLFSSPAACIKSIDARIRKLEKKYPDGDMPDIVTLKELKAALELISPADFSRYTKLLKLLNSTEYGWSPSKNNDRLVIFTERIETMRYLAENLKKDLGLKDNQLEVMHGGMSDKELQRIVDEFGRAESPIRVIVASDVASEGINLHYLCFTNLKQMLQQIMDHEEDSQIILTTHSNMIASRLNLRNVIWIAENHYLSLKNVEPQTSIFFEKADDNEFLQLLLSKKVILVEGATEYLLLPKFYEKKTGRTVENDGISIISCNGISYKRYLEIAEETGKRIAVITDNDHEQTKIDDANEFNQHNEKQHVFMGATMEDWTWEACVYNCNKEKLDTLIQVQDGAEYLFHRTNYGQVLGKMLNNKVDTAYQMLISEEDFVIPGYVEEAIEWLNE